MIIIRLIHIPLAVILLAGISFSCNSEEDVQFNGGNKSPEQIDEDLISEDAVAVEDKIVTSSYTGNQETKPFNLTCDTLELSSQSITAGASLTVTVSFNDTIESLLVTEEQGEGSMTLTAKTRSLSFSYSPTKTTKLNIAAFRKGKKYTPCSTSVITVAPTTPTTPPVPPPPPFEQPVPQETCTVPVNYTPEAYQCEINVKDPLSTWMIDYQAADPTRNQNVWRIASLAFQDATANWVSPLPLVNFTSGSDGLTRKKCDYI